MSIKSINLIKPIPKKYSEEFEKRVFFISEVIKSFSLVFENDLIMGIQAEVNDDVDIDSLTRKVNNVVEKEIAVQILQPPKIVWESKNNREQFYEDTFERMTQEGIAHECAEGQMSFGEPFLSLMEALDRKFKEIAINKMGGTEYIYPTLIPTRVLEDCGYFDSFPHMLM
ncbi:MAG: hypothetical protein K0R50_3567 [Eubacterium sp.]|nr:hypothetical protein [Eubacterium sp.]